MIKARTWRAFCRAGARAVALAMAALPSIARAGDIPVDVPWSISRPERLELSGTGPTIRLNYDSRSNHFAGRYPRNSTRTSFDNLNLVGWWNSREDRLLFLRVLPNTVRLNLRLLRPDYTECRSEFIRPLLQATYERDVALDAYYRAKALYDLNNRSRCLGDRRAAAARAWFDRSFDLARVDCAFRLSPDAARAYREFNANYVSRRSQEALAREVGCARIMRDHYLMRGDPRTAYSISRAMIEGLRNDSALRAIALQYQGLSLDALELDGARIEALLRPDTSLNRTDPSATLIRYNPAPAPEVQAAVLNLSTANPH